MQALNRQKEHSPIIATTCDLLTATTENLNKGRREEKRKRIHEFRSGCSVSLSKRRSVKFHVSVNLHHHHQTTSNPPPPPPPPRTRRFYGGCWLWVLLSPSLSMSQKHSTRNRRGMASAVRTHDPSLWPTFKWAYLWRRFRPRMWGATPWLRFIAKNLFAWKGPYPNFYYCTYIIVR